MRDSEKQIVYNLKIKIFLIFLYFSSIYVCESLFTTTNLIKSKKINVLTDETITAYISLRKTKI
jgi:hypothetical protein